MVGRRGVALGSLLVGVGLAAGLLIGRATLPRTGNPAPEPPAESTRFHQELTDTTPLAAAPVEEPPAPPAPPETPQPAVTTSLASVAPAPAKPAAPVPPPAAPPAPVTPPAAPAEAAPEAAPPPPDPGLVSQGRVFNNDSITSSTFDEADVTEYDPVPDHEVTRSSFDDEDRADSHPTGP